MKKTLLFVLGISLLGTAYAQSQRIVLVEEFTQASCGPCASQNPAFNALLAPNLGIKVVAVKYQTNWPGVDPMNTQTQTWVGPRVNYYNVGGVPEAIMDGNVYQGAPSGVTQSSINTRYNVASPFTLNLSHTIANNQISINLVITASQNFTSNGTLKAHVALIEKEINFSTPPGSNGETVFHDVMRQMIPNANGTTLASSWTNGQTQTLPFSVAVPSYIYDISKLQVVAFIQSDGNKQVHQAALSSPPMANFTASTTVTCTGQGINFSDQTAPAATSWSWSFPGGTPASSTQQNPTGIVWNNPGTYTVTLTASSANGSSTHTQVINILGGSLAPPLSEGFEGSTFLPANWQANNAGSASLFWTRANVGRNSSWSAKFDNFNNDAGGARDEMITPKMTLVGMQNCTLTFDVAHARYSATYVDSLEVLVSTNCGTTWTSVYMKGGTQLATVPDQTTTFTPTNTQWRSETVNLTPYVGQANVLIAIRNRGHYGNNIYVDNVNLQGTVSAGPVSAFTPSSTSVCVGTTVNFTNNSSGNPTSWSWTFPGGSPASSTSQNPGGVVWNSAGTYTVTLQVSNANGNNTSSQVITVNANPSVTSSGSTTICPGGNATLTASGAGSYAWQPGNLSGSSVNVSPAATTTYTVTGTSNNCSGTSQVTVNVSTPPAVPSITNVGNVLTASVSGTSYQWYLNGNPIAGATSQSYTATMPGSYTVEVFNANNCSSGQSAPTVITGMETNTLTAGFAVNPNPNNGLFNVSFVSETTSDYTVEVFNALGQMVYSEMIANFSGQYNREMNLSAFGAGLYTLRVRSNQGEATRRIVVKN
ncbi:MAG: PKD domain-containing protein [Bacteroidetes bacterium]|nr:PKD domain-containing protein [Bacteroidota bacterium]